MSAEHLAEVGRCARAQEHGGRHLRPHPAAPGADATRAPAGQPRRCARARRASEADASPRRQETQRRLLEWWAQQRNDYARSALFGTGISTDIGSKRAQERGIQLLRENLTPPQRRQYEKYGYFDVTGGKTGKRYRIRHGRQMNIEQLDRNGRRVCGWCFFPQGSLVSGDVMLAQKAALELFEGDALRIANRF